MEIPEQLFDVSFLNIWPPNEKLKITYLLTPGVQTRLLLGLFVYISIIYIYGLFFFPLYPPRIAFANCEHKLCQLYLIWNKLVVVVVQKSGDVYKSLHYKNVIFGNVWILSENHLKAFRIFPDINNNTWKRCQLSTMYWAIWLVDFWPFMLLFKIYQFDCSFLHFPIENSSDKALNPLLVLLSFLTSRK